MSSAGTCQVTRFWHSGITVSDLAASLVFYCNASVWSPSPDRSAVPTPPGCGSCPGARAQVVYLRVRGSDATLELLEFEQVEQHAAAARPWDIAHGPLAGAKVVYIVDPDGYHVELFERAPPPSMSN